jgi:MurNAc alpha-1-phosphate uridylyltransferase
MVEGDSMTARTSGQPPAQAMLLAAGRGERMRPLTDQTPKPLLPVQGKPLLQWHLEAMAQAGVAQVVVNTAWLEGQIVAACGDWVADGSLSAARSAVEHQNGRNANIDAHNQLQIQKQLTTPFGIQMSCEGQDFGGALETLGGICRALPRLDEVFWVAAADVFVPQFTYAAAHLEAFRASGKLAHLWLVPNPPHNPKGDFGLGPDGLALNLPKDAAQPHTAPRHTPPLHTYSTIGLYRRALFAPPWCDIPPGNPAGVKAPLAPLLRRAMDAGLVSATLYHGPWTDVGTPERLAQLNATAP